MVAEEVRLIRSIIKVLINAGYLHADLLEQEDDSNSDLLLQECFFLQNIEQKFDFEQLADSEK